MWRNKKKSQKFAIKKYAQFEGKSFGFDNLFELKYLKQFKYIKIIFQIYTC